MSDKGKYNLHPIQLVDLKVLKLSLEIAPEKEQDKLPDEGSFSLYSGFSDFNKEKREIAVKAGIKIDSDEDDSPFSLHVELLCLFSIGDKCPTKYIDSWADKNAPLILYPYLREHVHSLTSRAGFEGLILPLFEVPTFKINVEGK